METFIDGSTNSENWWYSIGAKKPYKGTNFPGPVTPSETPVTKVYLWIRCPENLNLLNYYYTNYQSFSLQNMILINLFVLFK